MRRWLLSAAARAAALASALLNASLFLAAAGVAGMLAYRLDLADAVNGYPSAWRELRWIGLACLWMIPAGLGACFGYGAAFLRRAAPRSRRARLLFGMLWLALLTLATTLTFHVLPELPWQIPRRLELPRAVALLMAATLVGLQPVAWLAAVGWRARPARLRGWPTTAFAVAVLLGMGWTVQPIAQRLLALRNLARNGATLNSEFGDSHSTAGLLWLAAFRDAQRIEVKGFDAAAAAALEGCSFAKVIRLLDVRDPRAAWSWLRGHSHELVELTISGGDFSFVTPNQAAMLTGPAIANLQHGSWRFGAAVALPKAGWQSILRLEDVAWAADPLPAPVPILYFLGAVDTKAPPNAAGTIGLDVLSCDLDEAQGWLGVVDGRAVVPRWFGRTGCGGMLTVSCAELSQADAARLAAAAGLVQELSVRCGRYPSAAALAELARMPKLKKLSLFGADWSLPPETISQLKAFQSRGVEIRVEGTDRLPP